jgi:hypothetical protein
VVYSGVHQYQQIHMVSKQGWSLIWDLLGIHVEHTIFKRLRKKGKFLQILGRSLVSVSRQRLHYIFNPLIAIGNLWHPSIVRFNFLSTGRVELF